jgi:acetaldehyde dehydrogenase
MRDTVLCLVDACDREAVVASVREMVARVQKYVPGYRLKQDVQFRRVGAADPENDLVADRPRIERTVVTVFLEVEGAGHYLPAYAGNLDIMTSAALRVGERLATAVPA